jgi:hypothetical protein
MDKLTNGLRAPRCRKVMHTRTVSAARFRRFKSEKID